MAVEREMAAAAIVAHSGAADVVGDVAQAAAVFVADVADTTTHHHVVVAAAARDSS